jgi:hypothetical protein
MKKIVRLTESDLTRIIQRIISEQPTRPVSPTAGQQPTIPGKKPAPTNPNTPTGQQVSQEQMGKIKATNDKFKAELGKAINNYFNGCVAILGRDKCTAGLNNFRAETLGNLEQKL